MEMILKWYEFQAYMNFIMAVIGIACLVTAGICYLMFFGKINKRGRKSSNKEREAK